MSGQAGYRQCGKKGPEMAGAVILLVLLFIILGCRNAWGTDSRVWFQETDGRWRFEAAEDGKEVCDTWKQCGQAWYHIDPLGERDIGWRQIHGYWYFFCPEEGERHGRMMTGWQWIDGYCYYLAENAGWEGAMYAGTETPDGYLVDESGRWVDERGNVQFVQGKGILTGKESIRQERRSGGKVTAGGGGGGSGHSDRGQERPEPFTPPGTGQGETSKPFVPPGTGQGEEFEPSLPPGAGQVDSFKPCTPSDADREEETGHPLPPEDGQGEDGEASQSPQSPELSTPSEAVRVEIHGGQTPPPASSDTVAVDWKISFIEQGHMENRIFKTQTGSSPEGTELIVDFPEMILGTDGYYYEALVSSPYTILLSGAGLQKYYIEYQKKGQAAPDPDPDARARASLEEWLMIAAEADRKITGVVPSSQQLVTDSKEASDQRIKNLVSAVDDARRHEIYLIAKGEPPNSLAASLSFPELTGISEQQVDSFSIEGELYYVVRIAFEKKYETDSCSHAFTVCDYVEAGCLTNGHETVCCSKCGLEETVILPAAGHRDQDEDGICDICFEAADGIGQPEPFHYDIGDVQAREIGGHVYLFSCIDDDYEDGLDNSLQSALFLCQSIIRSDAISGTGQVKKLSFGNNNNYKYSDVRRWLNSHAEDALFGTAGTYTGISAAYKGSTQKGDFDQFDASALTGYDKPFQLMEDRIFLLSVEEAVKYRDFLWKFGGSEENNPQTQYSAYSRGYYLRTPQYEGEDEFQYGKGIYAVDLSGRICAVPVSSQDIGIRPAFTLPQQ